MSSLPLISVVMAVYNASAFVREAIESTLSQTLSDFEFIIVDDGSTTIPLKLSPLSPTKGSNSFETNTILSEV